MTKGHTIPVLDHGYVRYVDHMGSDLRIVESARVSYLSPSKGPEKDKQLLFYLYKNRHTSPFEMVKLTLEIKLPIFVMRQYIRHRMQNVNEFSMRYSEAPNEFYIPTVWRYQDTKNKQGSIHAETHEEETILQQKMSNTVWETCANSFETYNWLLTLGVAREMARMVLPVNVYTLCYATWDLKNLIHFITLRDDPHAQYEIQQYGLAIKTILRELFPWTMEAYDRFKFPLHDNSPTPA